MARPIKKQQIPNLQEAIKETAWKLIAEFGAPALSLRAIARALSITAPAIYNYFPDRDALVTALTIDAFTSFGDFQLKARDTFSPEKTLERFHAIGLSYRSWALAYPQRYQLIFGTPIPGYEKPQMKILPSAARSISALVSVIEDLLVADRLIVENFPAIPSGYAAQLSAMNIITDTCHSISHGVSMIVWSRVHGLVSLEIGGHLPPFGVDGDALYHFELKSIVKQFIKELL